jgi:hypothetical protein
MVRRSLETVKRRLVDNELARSLAVGGVWILPGLQAFCCGEARLKVLDWISMSGATGIVRSCSAAVERSRLAEG